jgi:hypothetical protein
MVRVAAAGSLGALGDGSGEVVGALVAALGDSEGRVRAGASDSLGQLGVCDGRVAAALNRALHDTMPRASNAAYDALSKLLDGKPIPGGEWVSLKARRERSERRRRRAVIVLVPLLGLLIYVLGVLHVPWVREYAPWMLGAVAFVIAVLANVGKIRQTLGDWWK